MSKVFRERKKGKEKERNAKPKTPLWLRTPEPPKKHTTKRGKRKGKTMAPKRKESLTETLRKAPKPQEIPQLQST